MDVQDNSNKGISKIVESKEEERRLLSCNIADVRSSSLEFNPNAGYVSEDIALDYLAGILAEIYLHQMRHANDKTGGHLLSRVDQGAG